MPDDYLIDVPGEVYVPEPPEPEEFPAADPVPTCPECGGMLRRLGGVLSEYRCDLHGEVPPVWVQP